MNPPSAAKIVRPTIQPPAKLWSLPLNHTMPAMAEPNTVITMANGGQCSCSILTWLQAPSRWR
ncbi:MULTISPECIES: hypothetical protein [unclassified Caballeronia]|uniref:hypothetical protein n=1 Tax=unclassified Caballeronia TaxID=2646786 RepID=UPI00286174DD|nr:MULTISPECIES: hypothetical protein [unclassified Caballeronia]MDR5818192.1 hypothetical protein [Caballeronia sp. LZ033]MDR5825159.1 hypothetical protein [Caballeronia sp. LZ043]MDR5883032.1 hypothetical protein [Caballeronia sp. LZ032]